MILTGAGTVFWSGGNVKDMSATADAVTPAEIRECYRHGIQRMPLALYELDVPMIAAVNGPAIGAGCDLACMCDIRIASDEGAASPKASSSVGIVPGDGGAWLLPRVVGMSRALEMALHRRHDRRRPRRWPAAWCRAWCPSAVAGARRTRWPRASPPTRGQALRLTKRLLREGQHMRLDPLLELSAAMQALAHHTDDHAEAVNAFIDKREPKFGDV